MIAGQTLLLRAWIGMRLIRIGYGASRIGWFAWRTCSRAADAICPEFNEPPRHEGPWGPRLEDRR